MTITFEICKDRTLLNQYYRLRDTYFKKDLGLAELDKASRVQKNEVFSSLEKESSSNDQKVPKFYSLR